MKVPPVPKMDASFGELRTYIEDITKLLNQVSLGDGTNNQEQNLDIYHISGASNAVANTESAFTHNLGRVPRGYIIYGQNKAGRFYDGSTAWTSSKIYLKCDVAGVTFKAFIF